MNSNSFVLGIDPGKTFMAATLAHCTGEKIWKGRQFDMSRNGFEAFKAELPQGDLTIGVEASGRIDHNLMAFLSQLPKGPKRKVTLIRVNPGQSARFGGPKPRRDQTDGSDSEHVAEYTRIYANRLDEFDYDPEAQAMARRISERQRLVEDSTATKNRIHDQLLVCFPEFTQVFTDPFGKLALAVMREVPTARRAGRRQASSLARVKGERRSRSLGVARAQRLIDLAKRSIASANDEEDATALLCLLEQLKLIDKRLAKIEESLARYAERAKTEAKPSEKGVSAARQIYLLDSIRGIGLVSAGTLVLGTRGLTRFTSGEALSAQWASCPERTETGTSVKKSRLTAKGDHKRRAMLYLSAQAACVFDPAFAFHKWRMIQNGHRPQQAVCAAMNRLARIIWAIVNKNQVYDVNRMIQQIRIHHADLWKTFVQMHKDDRRLWKNVDPEHQKVA